MKSKFCMCVHVRTLYNMYMYNYVALKSKATHIFFYFDKYDQTFEPEKRKKESFLWILAVEHKLFAWSLGYGRQNKTSHGFVPMTTPNISKFIHVSTMDFS